MELPIEAVPVELPLLVVVPVLALQVLPFLHSLSVQAAAEQKYFVFRTCKNNQTCKLGAMNILNHTKDGALLSAHAHERP